MDPNNQQSARAKSVDTNGSLGLNLITNQNSKETQQNESLRLDQLNESLLQRNIQKLNKFQAKYSTPATGPSQNSLMGNSQGVPKKDLAAYSEWFHNLKEEEYDMRELSKKSSIIKYSFFVVVANNQLGRQSSLIASEMVTAGTPIRNSLANLKIWKIFVWE